MPVSERKNKSRSPSRKPKQATEEEIQKTIEEKKKANAELLIQDDMPNL